MIFRVKIIAEYHVNEADVLAAARDNTRPLEVLAAEIAVARFRKDARKKEPPMGLEVHTELVKDIYKDIPF
jgi:hypothetical protein